MKIKSFLILLPVLLGVLACHDRGPYVYVPVSDDYLPLQVGNRWQFMNTDGAVNGEVKWVDSKKVIDDKEYFLVINVINCSTCNSYPDSVYIRVDPSNGYVYSRKPSDTSEDNGYRLEAKTGDEWSSVVNANETAKITVQEVEITINSTIVKQCKSFHYNVKESANSSRTQTFARGIGFIEEYDNSGSKLTLQSATINGKEVSFEMLGC